MDSTIIFATMSLMVIVSNSSPIQKQTEDLQDVVIMSPDDQIHAIEELSLDDAVENLDPEEFNLPPPEDGEVMHTASNLVFRPLFSYRKIQEKRKRLYGSRRPSTTTSSPNSLRRSQVVYYSPQTTRYVYPSQNYQSYPGYYYGNKVYYYPGSK